jgi:hypothetical protein
VRPVRLKILGKPFEVCYVTGNEPLSEKLNGDCDPDKQRILIRDGQPLESSQDTLLHELIHAVDEAVDAKLRETQVKRLATGLLAVLKDNAGLVAFLRRRTMPNANPKALPSGDAGGSRPS